MNMIVENWSVIIAVIVFLVGGIMAVLRLYGLSRAQKYEQIRAWLLQAVILAEQEYGGGTGKMKLSAVYDKFCDRFPWIAKAMPFEMFSQYVDDALDEMREILSNNAAIASIVESKTV